MFNLNFYFVFILQFVSNITLKVGQKYVIANYTKAMGHGSIIYSSEPIHSLFTAYSPQFLVVSDLHISSN